MSRYAIVECADCGQYWVVEDVAGGRSEEQHECPRCGTHHADNQLRRRAKTQSWEEAVEKRSEILASKRNAGDEFDDVAHYTDLEEQIKVDVSHTEDAPEMRGNAARDGELLESHEANADLHRPATNTGTDREEVVDSTAESGADTVQTDKGRQPHQRTEILEAMASEALERHHTSVELDLTDPDNLYEDRGCIRLSPLNQTDLTQSIYEVTTYVSTELKKIVDKLTPLVIESAQKIATREDRPTDEDYTPIRAIPLPFWFSFDEETANKSALGVQSVVQSAPQACYWPDHVHFVQTDQDRVVGEHPSSSFCKEPDRLLTKICLREKQKRNHRGSLNLLSESTKGWSV